MSLGRWSARAAQLWMLLALLMASHVQAQAADSGKQPAAVDDQEARDLFRLGKQAFDEARYERALKYFKDAYDLSRRAQLQFNIASVLDRLRRDREAVSAYRAYLEQTPDAANRTLVEERIRLLDEALSNKSQPPPAPALQPDMPEPPAAVSSTPPNRGPAATVPTAAETARASLQPIAPERSAPTSVPPAPTSSSITSRWWFWTGLGVLAVAGAVVGVALSSGSTKHIPEGPAVLGPSTRVLPL